MKEKIREIFKNKSNQISLLIFVITMIVACSPLISKYCINGHDAEYHLLRIESLKEGILMGKPFLKINVLYFGGAGYASSMFYPDLLLYIPALLRCVGVSINASYHIFIAVCICACYLSAYYCVGKMAKSSYAGMLAAIVLTLCQYHMDDIFIRGAAGEYTAFIFLPFVIYGLYNLLYEDMDKPWILAVGYGGVLLCHTSTFVMCLVLGAAACIIKIKSFIKNKKLIVNLIITAVVTVAITVFYTIPMFEQMLSTTFKVSVPWNEPKFEAVRFAEIFYPVFPALGAVTVILFMARLLVSKKDNANGSLIEYADCLALAGLIYAVLATDLLPWDILGKYISFIQFPWRFFIMSSILFSVADALILNEVIRLFDKNAAKDIIAKGIVLVVLGVCSITALNGLSKNTEGYYDYSNDYYSYKPYTANVIGGEWLPLPAEDADALVEASEHMYSDDNTDIAFSRIKNTITSNIDKSYNYADVPFVYYKGYKAEINTGSGKVQLAIDGTGKNGLSRVYLNGNTGDLHVYYSGTVLQKISSLVSIISVLLIVILYVSRNRKKKLK